MSNRDVGALVGMTGQSVGRWRSRFVEHRIAGLGDLPRSGGPRSVSDEQVAALVKRTLESMPRNATHWSTRAMAEELGLSQSTVSRIWQAFGPQPHRSQTFKLSTDPYFVDKGARCRGPVSDSRSHGTSGSRRADESQPRHQPVRTAHLGPVLCRDQDS
ncbi:helix-turn-helix domain-containing protein [Streptomyces sp. AK04-3B]|uniref:helix-turn-helix domain-containing protein n=1 Tax=Streptomyces sp. AK04-3B TaxID=3028650 RepID=UPI0029B8D321|nr:helix-turn-helix domain-containing protein [Streptomyces sp. AK04-3B]MDX3798112.1 helix-turn-helix domain-containing protein [Streptomyces sp. AK04-3B]